MRDTVPWCLQLLPPPVPSARRPLPGRAWSDPDLAAAGAAGHETAISYRHSTCWHWAEARSRAGARWRNGTGSSRTLWCSTVLTPGSPRSSPDRRLPDTRSSWRPGVKVNRVTGLSHDIAYALATPDVRLLAPIPGRSAIGVEVPNRKRRLVTLGDVLRSGEAAGATHPLEVGLGMDISGRPRLLNLSELPHLLIAGATGAGKSSCINTIVTSMLVGPAPRTSG